MMNDNNVESVKYDDWYKNIIMNDDDNNKLFTYSYSVPTWSDFSEYLLTPSWT